MNHIKLFEQFKKTYLGLDQTWYTGSGSKRTTFTLDHLAKDNLDEHGPGIYLTNLLKDAEKYGEFVHVIKIESDGEIIKRGDKMLESDKAKAIKIIKEHAPDWEMNAMDYHEDPELGLKDFTNNTSVIDRLDFYEYVWAGFFMYEPKQFVEGMVANGIDAITTPGYAGTDGIAHMIVYNTDILKIQEVIQK